MSTIRKQKSTDEQDLKTQVLELRKDFDNLVDWLYGFEKEVKSHLLPTSSPFNEPSGFCSTFGSFDPRSVNRALKRFGGRAPRQFSGGAFQNRFHDFTPNPFGISPKYLSIINNFEAVFQMLYDTSIKPYKSFGIIFTTKHLTTNQIEMMNIPKEIPILVLTPYDIVIIHYEKIHAGRDCPILEKACYPIVTSFDSDISDDQLAKISLNLVDFCQQELNKLSGFDMKEKVKSAVTHKKLGYSSYGIRFKLTN